MKREPLIINKQVGKLPKRRGTWSKRQGKVFTKKMCQCLHSL